METRADWALFGGTAGSGKSYVLNLESLRWIHNPLFRAVYFRRTAADLRKPKSLWDTSHMIFPHFGGVARDAQLEWRFPSGAWLKMNHLELESSVHEHQSAEYPLIVWDEATHFTAKQIWYVSSRNRAPLDAMLAPYMRMSCNPDPDHFIMTDFLDPAGFIDEEGLPREEMSGVLMYFVRDEDEQILWGRSPDELGARAPHLFKTLPPATKCKSFTFIPAKLTDNPSMGEDYRAQLELLPRVDRMRLLFGNWRAREAAGEVFQGAWFKIVDTKAPAGCRRVRYWDLAGSKRRRSDLTAGCKGALMKEGDITIVEDVVSQKGKPAETEALIRRTALQDGRDVEVWIEEEKGAAGQMIVDHFARNVLPGYTVRGSSVAEGDKLTRMKPASSAAEQGRVWLVRAPWNKTFTAQLQAVPDGAHDDEADAFAGMFNRLHQPEYSWVTVKR